MRLDGPQGRSGQVRKISPTTGIRSSERPARSESLYRLSYPGPQTQRKQKGDTQFKEAGLRVWKGEKREDTDQRRVLAGLSFYVYHTSPTPVPVGAQSKA